MNQSVDSYSTKIALEKILNIPVFVEWIVLAVMTSI